MPFVQCLWLDVFAEKGLLSHPKKHLKRLPWKLKCVMGSNFGQAFRKLNSRLSTRGTWFSKGGTLCPRPLATGDQKCLASIGLSNKDVRRQSSHRTLLDTSSNPRPRRCFFLVVAASFPCSRGQSSFYSPLLSFRVSVLLPAFFLLQV